MPNSAISSCTPLKLAEAQSIDELRDLGIRVLDLIRCATDAGDDTKSIVRLTSQLNDAISLRLIALLDTIEGIRLPAGAAYLALGSGGRGDQILRTDQDSAIVYIDNIPPETLGDVERFATRLVDALEEISVPRCPGDIMASNPRWRHSLTEWKRLLNQWTIEPTPEHMLNFGIFQGLRALHGDKTLENELLGHIRAAAQLKDFFLPYMACHAVRFPPPLTIFRRIRVERKGEHRGKVDVKKAGIFAITLGTSLLALEAGITSGNTWEKLELLRERRVLAADDLDTIEHTFTSLVRLRLQWQLRELAESGRPTNYIDPQVMTDHERDQFRQALKGVMTFLQIFRRHYRLDFVNV